MNPLLLVLLLLATPSQAVRQVHAFAGQSPGDQLGTAICAVGDVDGDEVPDLAVGAPGDKRNGPLSGAVFVFSGKSGKPIHAIHGRAAQHRLGTAVAGAGGDLDGDGVPDLLVGVPHDDKAGPLAGSVWVISGRTGERIRSLPGGAPGETSGMAVAGAGDVNGDGVPDVLVGAPANDKEGKKAGAVRVFSGADGELLYSLYGAKAGDAFGSAVSGAGDLNQDDHDDFLVGAPQAEETGLVVVFSGKTGDPIYRVPGQASGSQFGASLFGGLDLNNDATPDFIVGAPSEDTDGENTGRVYAYSGKSMTQIRWFYGTSHGARLGTSVAGLPDIDGDRHGEVVAGADGAGNSGGVWILSAKDGASLQSYKGVGSQLRYGAAVAVLGDVNADGRHDLAIGGPGGTANGPLSGSAWVFTVPAPKPRAMATSGSTPPPTEAEPEEARLDEDFLEKHATKPGWHRIVGRDGRWVLYGTVDPALLRQAAGLLDKFYDRLDFLLGSTGEGRGAYYSGPVLLAMVATPQDMGVITREIGESFPHLAEWAAEADQFPRVQHWNPLIAAIRHDPSLAKVKRPEVQLVHMAIQQELCRRYGRLPYWICESLGYALQEELVDGVYGYSFRERGALDDEYHQGWKWGAQQAFQKEEPQVATLVDGSGVAFDQHRAYLQFGLAAWWLAEESDKLPALMQAILTTRGRTPMDAPYEPDAAEQQKLLQQVFGSDMLRNASYYWAGAKVEGGPGARLAAVRVAVEELAKDRKLDEYTDDKGRVRILSDFNQSTANKGLAITKKILRRLDKALGKPKNEGDATLFGFLLRDRHTYMALCDVVADANPRLAAFMERQKKSTGFTIYDPPITVYFEDVRVQEESRPELSIAHNLTHIEMHRRYGQLPLWLAEGIAVAGEEGATGQVWGNWNMDGFVYTDSRSAWKRRAKKFITEEGKEIRVYDWSGVPFGSEPKQVKKPKPTLQELYEYPATSHVDDLAHLAYAFATYGLDVDAKGFKKFLDAMQKAYQEEWVGFGRFNPGAERVEEIVAESFGEDFEKKFRRYWAKAK